MKTSKDRKNSGRKTTKIMHPETLPYEETKWDDWDDYRDSFRELGRDKTKITPISALQKDYKYRAYKSTNVIEMNEKNKRLVKIRKARANANKP